LIIALEDTVYRAIEVIQNGHEGIALVVDGERRLIATITDGDIRRAILNKVRVDDTVGALIHDRSDELKQPTTAPVGTPKSELLQTLKDKVLRQIPILDEEGRLVELVLLTELMEDVKKPLSAVVMAGGFGKRLHPLTEDTPKPMLPFQGRPLMERTIDQLRETGIDKVCITMHHKPDVITDYFRDGGEFGVDIDYVNESTPLGTAGALSLMDKCDHTFLVINGDVVTQLDFRKMHEFHSSSNAMMTVGIRKVDFQVPYGVVETKGVDITTLVEKPDYTFFVNAGVYLLEPETYDYIPSESHFDMTDLIQKLIDDGRRVIAFPIQEYWLDIGQPGDYQKAMEDAASGRL
jgi:dTDP-glucose pyrophosphorylase